MQKIDVSKISACDVCQQLDWKISEHVNVARTMGLNEDGHFTSSGGRANGQVQVECGTCGQLKTFKGQPHPAINKTRTLEQQDLVTRIAADLEKAKTDLANKSAALDEAQVKHDDKVALLAKTKANKPTDNTKTSN